MMKYDDVHLNLFYCYDQGNYDDIEKERVLENNITRALINVFCHSNELLTNDFLTKMLDEPIGDLNNKWQFALQSLGSESGIRESLKKAKQFVLGISPSGRKPEKIEDIADEILQHVSEQKISRSDLKTKLRKILDDLTEKDKLSSLDQQNTAKLIKNSLGYEIKSEETLHYLYEVLIHKSRPDAWIIRDDVAVLIENKIHGDLYGAQIERHKRENLKIKTGVQERFKSWKDIYNFFKTTSCCDEKTKFLIEQFIYYLEAVDMAGFQGIPFGQKGESYSPDRGKRILENLVEELSPEVEKIDNSLIRKKKKVGAEWDTFGSSDLHFTVYIWPENEGWAGLDLFCIPKTLQQQLKEDGEKWLHNEIEHLFEVEQPRKQGTPSSRYWVNADSYKLLDYTRGMMKGSQYESQKYSANIGELHRLGEEVQRRAISFILYMVRYCKYFRISKQFHYASKEDQELLQSLCFKDEIIRGIRELLPIYQRLHT